MTFRQSAIWLCTLAGASISGLAQPGRPSEALRGGSVMSFNEHINSPFSEHSPVLSPDGRTLFFSRFGDPLNFGLGDADDIWVSYRQEDGNWSRAINAGAPLNDMRSNRVVAVNPAGNRIYLITSDTLGEPTDPGLYVATREGRSWSAPQPVELPGYENRRPGNSFFLNADERILLFTAETGQSLGQRDIFACLRQADGSWGRPVHLGPEINTPGDERHVILAADEQTIYFSSDGLPGRGGSDIFLSRRLDESWQKWSNPVNLGAVVNTAANDDQFSLSAAGNALVFMRELQPGNTDLLRAALPVALRPYPVVLVQGQIASGNPASTRLYYMRLDQGIPLPEEVSLRGEGRFRFIVPASTAAIGVYAVTDTGFATSQCLPLAGDLPGLPDADPAPVIRLLRADSAYQQREREIHQLQKQLSEVSGQLAQLQQQIDRFYQIRDLPLDTACFDSASVRNVMTRYLSFFDSMSVAGKTVASDTVAAAGASLEEVRQRLRAQRTQAQAPSLPAPAPSSPEEKPLSATALRRAVWEQLIQRNLPLVRHEVEAALIRNRLEALQAGKRADSFQQDFLSGRLSRLLADTSATDLPGPVSAGREDWLQQMEADLAQVLQKQVREGLEEELRAPAEVALESALRHRRLELHQGNLREALEKRLNQQISLEQSMLEEVAPVEQAGTPQESSLSTLPVAMPASFREIQLNIALLPLAAGQTCTLSGVFFASNSAELLPVSEIELQRLADVMTAHPSLGVEIIAHSHNMLCHSQALAITGARAQAVAGFLSSRGIDPKRISARGAGKLEPALESETGEIIRENQRICVRWFNL